MLDRGENLQQALVLRPADKKDLAFLEVRNSAIATDLDRPRAETFTADSLVEKGAERVVSEDTDEEWWLRILWHAGRPIDKLHEIEQEDGLQLILGGPRGLDQ